MKKLFAFVLAGILAMSSCMVTLAAPPTEAPSQMEVAQDGKAHSVYVFGTALALISTDGSIEVSSIGSAGRVDVMMDGVVIKNVSTVDIPAGQRTRMALEEGSIIVKDATPESGAAIKQQIADAYASGADSVDLASLTEVTAYKVNKDGAVESADGKSVPANTLEMSVTSVDAAVESFEEVMEEIAAEERAKEAAAQSRSNSEAPASICSSGSSSSVVPDTPQEPGEEGGGNQGGGGNQEGGGGNQEGGGGNQEGGGGNQEGGGGNQEGGGGNQEGGGGN